LLKMPFDPEYASPVVRAPSPASSVGSTFKPDLTSLSDSEDQLSQEAFERKWEERLQLGQPTMEELLANEDPLLPRPTTKTEETILYEKVLRSLRQQVQNLEQNELFEQTLLRGSQVHQEEHPVPKDIDVLMRDMMRVPTQANTSTATADSNVTVSRGPWNQTEYRYEGGGRMDLSAYSNTQSAGKRSKPRGRSRRG